MSAITPKLNYFWAALIVEEFIRAGITNFCLSPGSRCSPLTLAIANHPKANPFVHYDERGTAFYALGRARANRKPSVVISTSGTAVANFFPAIVEGSKDGIPLLILTADRPPELQDCGANQTIDQAKFFGDYVRWHFVLPCPTPEIGPEFVLSTVDHAIFRSTRPPSGPVHLNCMFREPLLPNPYKTPDSSSPFLSRATEVFLSSDNAPCKQRLQEIGKTSEISPPRGITDTNTKTFSEEFGGEKVDYLQRIKTWLKGKSQFKPHVHCGNFLQPTVMKGIAETIGKCTNGLLVAGRLEAEEDREAVLRLSQHTGWPVFADIGSGLRIGFDGQGNIIPYHHLLLKSQRIKNLIQPEVLIQINGQIVSKTLLNFIHGLKPKHLVTISNHPSRIDSLHAQSEHIEIQIQPFCDKIISSSPRQSSTVLLNRLREISEYANTSIEEILQSKSGLSEPGVARLLSRLVPKNTTFFLASSMPIRDLDMFADFRGNPHKICMNRGASGIDGTIATAVGFTKESKQSGTLFIGDLACLHDLNSLAMIRENGVQLVIVVINNNGGGIFSFLPVGNHKDVFEKYFGTPHNLTFKAAAEMFGLEYYAPVRQADFITAYEQEISLQRSAIIEVRTDREENKILHQELQKKVLFELENFIEVDDVSKS